MISKNFSSVDEYVSACDGNRVIKKILIANNGIGAVKAIRSIRRWAYENFGNERIIQFVVMATPDDMRANAEYIRMADFVVDVPGGPNNNNYANVMLIVETAERWHVDAVWAGWGHASENPLLPESLAKSSRKICFIGPDGGPMRALGDKIGSTLIAQSCQVPTIAWNGDSLKVDYRTSGIPTEIYNAACIKNTDEALLWSKRIGFPVMIKASEGGGGKGIRKVVREEDVAVCYRLVQSEVPGSPIFIMKMASNSRHLEVQVLADQYGQAIALNGRDCSIQRRHQKIIEEGPPQAASPIVWAQMQQAAIDLAKMVGYSNAGTVEYLYSIETNNFFFLELNPRLQVEHPVTEMITRVNLPACQLQVAMGIPLHRIPDIRHCYGGSSFGKELIDLSLVNRAPPHGHCIAVRITAENADQGFKPTSGNIQELNFRSTPDVWGYFSVDSSGLVHEFADSQFGHLFAGGDDREAARKNMVMALKELSIRGDIQTTVEYMIEILQSDAFVTGQYDTAWLDGCIQKRIIDSTSSTRIPVNLVVVCGAAVTVLQESIARAADCVDMIRRGQSVPMKEFQLEYDVQLIFQGTKYILHADQSSQNSFVLSCNRRYKRVDVRSLADGGYLVNLGGKNRVVYGKNESVGLRLIIDSQTFQFSKEYDPSTLSSEITGKLSRLLVVDGAHIEKNAPYAEVEVMKMFMPITAPESGVIHPKLSEGASLSPGDVIARLDLDNPECVSKAELFSGDISEPHEEGSKPDDDKPHIKMGNAFRMFKMVMDGFYVPTVELDAAILDFTNAFHDRLMPVYEFEEQLSVLRGRIDGRLFEQLEGIAEDYRNQDHSNEGEAFTRSGFPVREILPILDSYGKTLPERDRSAFISLIETLSGIVIKYKFGIGGRAFFAILDLINLFLNVERNFEGATFDDVTKRLKRSFPKDLEKVYSLCRSHCSSSRRISLMLTLLRLLKAESKKIREFSVASVTGRQRSLSTDGSDIFSVLHTKSADGDNFAISSQKSKIQYSRPLESLHPVLQELRNLRSPQFSQISLSANMIMIEETYMSFEVRMEKLDNTIRNALSMSDESLRSAVIDEFIQSNVSIRDLLLSKLCDNDPRVRAMSTLIYVKKIYQKTHDIHDFVSCIEDSYNNVEGISWMKWSFNTRRRELVSLDMPSYGSYADLNDAMLLHRGVSGHESDEGSRSEVDIHPIPSTVTRLGFFLVCSTMDAVKTTLVHYLNMIPSPSRLSAQNRVGAVNAVHLAISQQVGNATTTSEMQDVLQSCSKLLKDKSIRRVTLLIGILNKEGAREEFPGIFTFRSKLNFMEDELFRHIEPPHAFHLDLPRLRNFDVKLVDIHKSQSGNVHLYQATPRAPRSVSQGKDVVESKSSDVSNCKSRFFLRCVTFTNDLIKSDAMIVFLEGLDVLTFAIGKYQTPNRQQWGKNHIFLNVIAPDTLLPKDYFVDELKKLMEKYADKLNWLSVDSVEMKITCQLNVDGNPNSIRLLAHNPTGFNLRIEVYAEVVAENQERVFKRIGGSSTHHSTGIWDNTAVTNPYPIFKEFEDKRTAALASSDTLYCFDYLELFERAVEISWENYATMRKQEWSSLPSEFFSSKELVIGYKNNNGDFITDWTAADERNLVVREVERSAGLNDVGVVSWLITAKTPEVASGRKIVVIANDITFKAGSFGTRESIIFQKASEYARNHNLPRIFLSANSGARIGISESLKSKFKVAWKDESDPTIGFRYLYLSMNDYNSREIKQFVLGKEIFDEGEARFVISDIIGSEPDLSFENLSGSGLIAGETSRAYDSIFTLSIVVGRTVGIGAYLVRLGQRVIQKTYTSPIILTGYQALNKLIGRDIYVTNDQLGGISIMYPNGVTHVSAKNDMEAISAAVRWLSYVPAVHGGYLPIEELVGLDTVDRPVRYLPPSSGASYDPRFLLQGCEDNVTGEWSGGIFDRGSFMETCGGWAMTVVTGRARLGGIPVGVIITENRSVEKIIPADPADASSVEKSVAQAGCVWFPDSAFKTAQAIEDVCREELPLFVFANWRGFSGGERDMFDEVLKFGSFIVDALVNFKQQIFVYIPPFSELRGGAWVVIDSKINEKMMEMYACETARGGVLEAAGTAAIKYRDEDVRKTAFRLDPTLQDLKLRRAAAVGEEGKVIEVEINKRLNMLMTVYSQIAVQFTDLHDSPGRMSAVGVIRRMVPWEHSRSYFYWRLRRKLAEFDISRLLHNAIPNLSQSQAIVLLEQWHKEQTQENSIFNADSRWDTDDKHVLEWIQNQQGFIQRKAVDLRRNNIQAEIQRFGKMDLEGVTSSFVELLQNIKEEDKEAILARLNERFA